MNAKTRDYKRFAQRTDATPHVRHGRELDTAARERIARPIHATPRRANEWR